MNRIGLNRIASLWILGICANTQLLFSPSATSQACGSALLLSGYNGHKVPPAALAPPPTLLSFHLSFHFLYLFMNLTLSILIDCGHPWALLCRAVSFSPQQGQLCLPRMGFFKLPLPVGYFCRYLSHLPVSLHHLLHYPNTPKHGTLNKSLQWNTKGGAERRKYYMNL